MKILYGPVHRDYTFERIYVYSYECFFYCFFFCLRKNPILDFSWIAYFGKSLICDTWKNNPLKIFVFRFYFGIRILKYLMCCCIPFFLFQGHQNISFSFEFTIFSASIMTFFYNEGPYYFIILWAFEEPCFCKILAKIFPQIWFYQYNNCLHNVPQ